MTGEPLVLATRLDLGSVAALAAQIEARTGADLIIDAGRVAFLGGLAAQTLLAAQARWRADGLVLQITHRSPAFTASVGAMGLTGALAEGAVS